jgi:arsenite methyltransferase
VLQFDEEASRRVEASYTTPDIVAQRRAVIAALALEPGEEVLDIGSGPGLLAADMAEVVGSEGRVVGVDPSESMLVLARHRNASPGAAPTEFRAAEAGALPFEDASFDAAVSTQVYEYLEDVPAALDEAHRVLRPSGRLLVLDTDWDSIVWRSSDDERMHRVLAAWDEHLADPHLPRRLSRLLGDAGLRVAHRSALPILNTGYDPNTYSANLIGFVSGFVPGRGGLAEHDVAAWRDDVLAQGDDAFFSLNRYVFVAVKD